MDHEIIETADVILKSTLDLMGLEYALSHEVLADAEDETLHYSIQTEEPGYLIGYHGQTLQDLEFFVNLALFKKRGSWSRVLLNVGEYRQKREAYLTNLAVKTAEKAKYLREPVALSPMTAGERRVIHLALKDDPTVKTESVGEGDKRKVVIRPA